jgi:uroporphyrinogen decarboxylase
MVPSGLYHFWGYVSPLRDARRLDELEAYPLDEHTTYPTGDMAGAVAKAHAAGRVAVGNVVHMYETSWQIRGYEQFLTDLIAQPEWAECLLDKVARRCMFRATASARAGVDYLLCGDDVANQVSMMFSPQVWRRFMKDRWAKVWAAARAIKPDIEIFYHSDGNIMDIIPDLIETGVTILNPVQPECVDPLTIKRRFGNKVVLHGTIGTQTTMPFGAPEQVRQIVKQRVETLAGDGALILAPTHVLEPDVPIANIEAFFDACRQYGRLECSE